MSFLANLFGGGGNTQIQPAQINWGGPSGFSSPGVTGSYSGGQYNIGQTPQLSSAIGGLQNTLQGQAGALRNLAGTVAPGFSQFRRAGLADLATQQRANISNLRDNLAQRRVLGSSFANSQVSQANADYAQNRANFIAQSYLQEVSTSQSLINQQYQAAAQSYTVGINQMNLESGMAAQLTQQASQLSAQMAQAQAGLNQQAAQFNAQQQAASDAGVGKLIGTIASIGLAPFTGGLSLAALPAFSGGGGGGGQSGGGQFFSGGQYTGPSASSTFNFLTQPFNPTGA